MNASNRRSSSSFLCSSAWNSSWRSCTSRRWRRTLDSDVTTDRSVNGDNAAIVDGLFRCGANPRDDLRRLATIGPARARAARGSAGRQRGPVEPQHHRRAPRASGTAATRATAFARARARGRAGDRARGVVRRATPRAPARACRAPPRRSRRMPDAGVRVPMRTAARARRRGPSPSHRPIRARRPRRARPGSAPSPRGDSRSSSASGTSSGTWVTGSHSSPSRLTRSEAAHAPEQQEASHLGGRERPLHARALLHVPLGGIDVPSSSVRARIPVTGSVTRPFGEPDLQPVQRLAVDLAHARLAHPQDLADLSKVQVLVVVQRT